MKLERKKLTFEAPKSLETTTVLLCKTFQARKQMQKRSKARRIFSSNNTDIERVDTHKWTGMVGNNIDVLLTAHWVERGAHTHKDRGSRLGKVQFSIL